MSALSPDEAIPPLEQLLALREADPEGFVQAMASRAVLQLMSMGLAAVVVAVAPDGKIASAQVGAMPTHPHSADALRNGAINLLREMNLS